MFASLTQPGMFPTPQPFSFLEMTERAQISKHIKGHFELPRVSQHRPIALVCLRSPPMGEARSP